MDERKRWAARIAPDLTPERLFVMGLTLYWAEGQKDKPWRAHRQERVVFVNSDPRVVQVFLAWLRLVGVEATDCDFRLTIHVSADVPAAESFWASFVGIPVQRLRRTVLLRHTPSRNHQGRPDYRGCLRVDVRRSTELYRAIEGWWLGMTAGVDAVAISPPDAGPSWLCHPKSGEPADVPEATGPGRRLLARADGLSRVV